jgi:hypothetical protein
MMPLLVATPLGSVDEVDGVWPGVGAEPPSSWFAPDWSCAVLVASPDCSWEASGDSPPFMITVSCDIDFSFAVVNGSGDDGVACFDIDG